MSTGLATSRPKSFAQDFVFTFVLIKPTHYDDRGYPDSMVPIGAAVEHACLHEQSR